MKRLRRYSPTLVLVTLILLTWQLYVSLSGIRQTILPSPWRILEALYEYREIIADHFLYTWFEAVIGFGLAATLGFALAVLLDSSILLKRAIYPLLVASQTVPIVAIAPLLVIWFGYGLLPKMIVVWLYCFFPIVVAGVDGFASTDPEMTRLFASLNASRWQIFMKLRLPSALPFLFSGLRIAITYSLAAAIAAEYVGAQKGLGIFILQAKNSFSNQLIFAAVFVTAFVSVLLFLMVSLIERRAIAWYYRMRESRKNN